jgi:hypothetical protein
MLLNLFLAILIKYVNDEENNNENESNENS